MQKEEVKRIVIDCTEDQHKEVKSYCALKGKKMRELCLEAVKEKMERER